VGSLARAGLRLDWPAQRRKVIGPTGQRPKEPPVLAAILNPTSWVKSSGYAAIFVLSVLQSCCVPTSSELTLGFAGFLAYEGELSLPGAIAVGAFGEVVGAYIAWFIGRAGGRRFIDRFGRYILLSHRDLDRAEAWYQRHGQWGVLVSRLLPVVRNFVALPAGVAEVPLLRFGLLTAAGSLIWDGAMAVIGYELGGSWKSIMHGFSDAGYVLAALAVAAIAVLLAHRYRHYRDATSEPPGEPVTVLIGPKGVVPAMKTSPAEVGAAEPGGEP
jgi:membrane protein DedA with SNARE-associated domain